MGLQIHGNAKARGPVEGSSTGAAKRKARFDCPSGRPPSSRPESAPTVGKSEAL